MIEDGSGYAMALVMQKLLRTLESKGVLSNAETFQMLDEVCDKLANDLKGGVVSPMASAEGSRRVGLLYLPKRTL